MAFPRRLSRLLAAALTAVVVAVATLSLGAGLQAAPHMAGTGGEAPCLEQALSHHGTPPAPTKAVGHCVVSACVAVGQGLPVSLESPLPLCCEEVLVWEQPSSAKGRSVPPQHRPPRFLL